MSKRVIDRFRRGIPAPSQGRRRRAELGSQLVELAIAVPVLFLILFGLWDLGSAFAMKQKLTNAAREGASVVTSNPSDLLDSNGNACTPAPCSYQVAAETVAAYLNNARLDASCIETTKPTQGSDPSGEEWIYSCNNITLDINHGAAVEVTSGTCTTSAGTLNGGAGSPCYIPATKVTLSYPLTWRAEGLLPEPVPSIISTTVEMQNLYN
jgi:TadE-like protein